MVKVRVPNKETLRGEGVFYQAATTRYRSEVGSVCVLDDFAET